MHRTLARAAIVLTVATLLAPAVEAQQERFGEVQRNAAGEVFDFHPDGGWRVLARRVAQRRREMLARGDFAGLNAAMASPSTAYAPAAITGVRRVPAILFRFADAGTAPLLPSSAGDTSKYNLLLFSPTAPTGLGYATPYSQRSYYSQLSTGLLDFQGAVIGWFQLDDNEVTYTGGANCAGMNPIGGSNNCSGVWSGAATTAMRAGLTEVLADADVATNFALYDNDGIDGVSAFNGSTDDDGFVDMTIFVHSEVDGACNTAHLWSHRSQIPSGGFTTNDARPPGAGGGFVKVRDYTLQSGLGGTGGCSASFIMSVGTAAHESGHALGLPDLYDVTQASEGIGSWGLMGAGNSTSGASPSRMEAWSLNELGWVTLVPITVNGNYSFGAAPVSDTAFVIRVPNPNTRKEHFFIENRQASQSDTAMIRTMCQRSGMSFVLGGGGNCRGGLAIWQADSTKIVAGKPVNQMNTGGVGSIHGLALIQADNLKQLDASPGSVANGRGRGDAGDLFPGFSTSNLDSLPNTKFSFNTTPKAVKNADGTFAGFEVSNITQVAPDGAMSFAVAFGGLTVVRAADTTAQIKLDGVAYNRFAGLLAEGVQYAVTMDSPQLSANGKTQFTWVSWSNGQTQSHAITGNFAGDSISATVSKKYKIQAVVQGTGSVASTPTVNHTAGAFVDPATPMTLTGTPGAGSVFQGWLGDTTTNTNPLVISSVNKPYVVTAVFSPSLAQTSGAAPGPIMGKLYTFNLTASGGTGQYSWTQTGGAFPTGMTLSADGTVTGTPEAAGSFTINVRVTSGVQTSDGTLSLTVTEPTLAVVNVLGGLLGTGGTLSTDDRKYLDLIGNKNNSFDLGDFLAWVEKTNATPPATPISATPPEDPPEIPWWMEVPE